MIKWRELITSALYEDGELSLTRLLAAVNWLFFAVVSSYLVISGKSWDNYSVFAGITGAGGTASQLINKYTNSRYNTEAGSYRSK